MPIESGKDPLDPMGKEGCADVRWPRSGRRIKHSSFLLSWKEFTRPTLRVIMEIMELHIVLVEPEIPQNTGSIGRTCMATGATLHLIRPLGFEIDNTRLKRAGLDYWHELDVQIHDSWDAFTAKHPDAPLWFYTTKARKSHDQGEFGEVTYLVFGKETAGLPDSLLETAPERCLRIPLLSRARSLNLSVAVGVASFEALRHKEFEGLSEADPEGRLFG